jgi:CRP/FNR family transcriptional regulator
MKGFSTLHSCTVRSDKCDCFEKLTEDDLALMEDNQVQIKYRKGEMICKHGTFASHVIYLQKGLIKVYLEGDNESLILKIIPAGNLINLSSILKDNNIFHYSALAYEDTEAILIDINIFRQIINTNVAFASSIIDILCENSLQTFGRFFSLTHKQLYGRLADIILCLAERIFKSNDFELNLSRKELAELSGMSTESVIRMLKKFKDDGIISMNGKTISIKNHDMLMQISTFG